MCSIYAPLQIHWCTSCLFHSDVKWSASVNKNDECDMGESQYDTFSKWRRRYQTGSHRFFTSKLYEYLFLPCKNRRSMQVRATMVSCVFTSSTMKTVIHRILNDTFALNIIVHPGKYSGVQYLSFGTNRSSIHLQCSKRNRNASCNSAISLSIPVPASGTFS